MMERTSQNLESTTGTNGIASSINRKRKSLEMLDTLSSPSFSLVSCPFMNDGSRGQSEALLMKRRSSYDDIYHRNETWPKMTSSAAEVAPTNSFLLRNTELESRLNKESGSKNADETVENTSDVENHVPSNTMIASYDRDCLRQTSCGDTSCNSSATTSSSTVISIRHPTSTATSFCWFKEYQRVVDEHRARVAQAQKRMKLRDDMEQHPQPPPHQYENDNLRQDYHCSQSLQTVFLTTTCKKTDQPMFQSCCEASSTTSSADQSTEIVNTTSTIVSSSTAQATQQRWNYRNKIMLMKTLSRTSDAGFVEEDALLLTTIVAATLLWASIALFGLLAFYS